MVLGISGSLRAASLNTEILRAVAGLMSPDIRYEVYPGLDTLPHFNPDRADESIPAVTELRHRVRSAHGLLICSPEYARGVPGALKNALDWLVGGTEIVGKPVALLNASPHSTHAHAALIVTLETMSARIVRDASITLPLRGPLANAAAMLADLTVADALHAALAALVREMRKNGNPSA